MKTVQNDEKQRQNNRAIFGQFRLILTNPCPRAFENHLILVPKSRHISHLMLLISHVRAHLGHLFNAHFGALIRAQARAHVGRPTLISY